MDNNIYIKNPNNQQSRLKIWLLRVLLVGIPTVIIILVVIYLGSLGYISISFEGDAARVSLRNKNSNKIIDNFISGSSHLVRKGTYTNIVKNSNGSHVSALSTKGFLQKTTTLTNLKPESESTIIATNPYQCTLTIGGVVYSYQCVYDSEITPMGNEAIKFKKQFFDSNTKTINTSTIEALSYNQQLMSLAQVNDSQVWATVKVSPINADDVESQEPYTELRQYSNGDFVTPAFTRKLDNSKLTGIQAYQNGVILYSKDSVEGYYLATFNGGLEKIPFASLPKIDGYGFDIIVHEEYLSYYYKNIVRDAQKTKKPKNLSISSVQKLANPKITKTSYSYTSAFICSSNTICVFNQSDGRFIVQNSNTKTLFGVSDYTSYDDKILINIDNAAVLYDIQTNNGYIVYSGSDDSNICGMRTTQKQIRLCVDSRESGDTYAVQLNLAASNTINTIDAINQIGKNNHVGYITALGNTIFINTDLSQTYNPTTKTYNVDENMRQYATKTIMQAVKDAGVDTTKYNVIIN